ncbi:hypothetical protein Y032_0248g82 [Ancylostoma ceylanicum]|uniref:Uncharacterized protein n=1 Tax=Ancylostoma ceylanicum TaxID=53326 RepID=A0A016SDJ9_9BILA|nr:hypothetical protein Y032_0248g82 [Ancylostoma ceylanicum]
MNLIAYSSKLAVFTSSSSAVFTSSSKYFKCKIENDPYQSPDVWDLYRSYCSVDDVRISVKKVPNFWRYRQSECFANVVFPSNVAPLKRYNILTEKKPLKAASTETVVSNILIVLQNPGQRKTFCRISSTGSAPFPTYDRIA